MNYFIVNLRRDHRFHEGACQVEFDDFIGWSNYEASRLKRRDSLPFLRVDDENRSILILHDEDTPTPLETAMNLLQEAAGQLKLFEDEA